MEIFVLSCKVGHGKQIKYHLKPPNEIDCEDFNSLCGQLSKTVSRELLGKNRLIGWEDIVKGIVQTLVSEYNYTIVNFKHLEFNSKLSYITDSFPLTDLDKSLEEDLFNVIEHNANVGTLEAYQIVS